jgi:hypothetical protein
LVSGDRRIPLREKSACPSSNLVPLPKTKVILMRAKVPVPVYSERLNVVVPSPLHDAITEAAHSSMQ